MMATARVQDLARTARQAGYHVHYMQPTAIAAVCARLFGRRIQPLAVLRKD